MTKCWRLIKGDLGNKFTTTKMGSKKIERDPCNCDKLNAFSHNVWLLVTQMCRISLDMLGLNCNSNPSINHCESSEFFCISTRATQLNNPIT